MKALFPILWLTTRGHPSQTHAANMVNCIKSQGVTACGRKIGEEGRKYLDTDSDDETGLHVTCVGCDGVLTKRRRFREGAMPCSN